ncbi:MAG: dienelactone hydrolase family protein [Myxococcota bacterium]|nr:dienelactone hydrolase family protein [Myxococcota bacterium]
MTPHRHLLLFLLIPLIHLFGGCDERDHASPLNQAAPWGPGPYPSSHQRLEVDLPDQREAITLELWYPGKSPAPPDASPVSFEVSPENQEALSSLLQRAPEGCPTARIQSRRGGAPRLDLGARPLLIFSHCHNCGRYSSFSLAERLASHGFIVLSADHAGPLPFLEGAAGEPLSREQLDLRAAQIRQLLDLTLAGTLFEESGTLQGLRVDPDRVGIFGHSFGAVTAGRVTQVDDRIRALAGLAAPIENPLLPGVKMAEIKVPVLFVLAEEDNSIQEVGNMLLRANYEAAHPPAWRVDLADAGHWSLSDLCALTEPLSAGCGEGIRHSSGRAGELFDFIPVARGIQITQDYLTAFFLTHLEAREDARQQLAPSLAPEGVRVWVREE